LSGPLIIAADNYIYSYYNNYNDLFKTYAGKVRNSVSRRYLCVKNNDLLYKPGFFA